VSGSGGILGGEKLGNCYRCYSLSVELFASTLSSSMVSPLFSSTGVLCVSILFCRGPQGNQSFFANFELLFFEVICNLAAAVATSVELH
jgi:hypothetical protein